MPLHSWRCHNGCCASPPQSHTIWTYDCVKCSQLNLTSFHIQIPPTLSNEVYFMYSDVQRLHTHGNVLQQEIRVLPPPPRCWTRVRCLTCPPTSWTWLSRWATMWRGAATGTGGPGVTSHVYGALWTSPNSTALMSLSRWASG